VVDGESWGVAPARSLRTLAVPAAVLALALLLSSVVAIRPADAVVGGSEVPEGRYRWLVSLQADGSHICGGTVIAQRWVLTAAHCVEGTPAGRLSIVAGSVDHTKGRRIPVARVRIHGRWNPDALSFDAALLRLRRDAKVPAVRLARPADAALWQHGAPVTTAGWGSRAPLVGMVPPLLDTRMHEVPLEVVGDAQCTDATAPGVQVCAAALLKDSCHGDSGGPLFATRSRTAVQVGIVSYGTGCAVPTFSGVYTEVGSTPIRSFIRRVTGV
jgi:secreted trypsin-like serine protease